MKNVLIIGFTVGITSLAAGFVIAEVVHCEGSKELCARKLDLNKKCNKMPWCNFSEEIQGCIKDPKCGEQEVSNLEYNFEEMRKESYDKF